MISIKQKNIFIDKKNQSNKLTYYILPINNADGIENLVSKYIAPIEIHVQPTIKNKILNVKFDFKIAGNYELPENCFLCDVSILNQVVKNVPVYLKQVDAFSSPSIFKYSGETNINLTQTWDTQQLHNQNVTLSIKPFLNPQIIGTTSILVGDGTLQEFERLLNEKCCFESYFLISNYFDEQDLTKQKYEEWIPIDYSYNYKLNKRPQIENLNRNLYYFEPKLDLNNLTKPIKFLWNTNAIENPKKIFKSAQLILNYQVNNYDSKQLVYNYDLPTINNEKEFNIGFNTNYDFNNHEIKIISNNNSGYDGLYFPEQTIFSMSFKFIDQEDNIYSLNINGDFKNNLIDEIKNNLTINELNANAGGKWYSVFKILNKNNEKEIIKNNKNFNRII